jgi:hypothetical protein
MRNNIQWSIVITTTTILLVIISILMGAHGGAVLCFLLAPITCVYMFAYNSNKLFYYLLPLLLLGVGGIVLVS